MRPDNNRVITGAAAACLLAAFGVSLCVGRYPLGFSDILGALSSAEGMAAQVFWRLRLPRSLAVLLSGGALGVAGAVYQALLAFRQKGWAVEEEGRWHFTVPGFLISNTLIGIMLQQAYEHFLMKCIK